MWPCALPVCESVCMSVCLKCAAAKSDRTQAHISLPRERYKDTHTHTEALSLLSLSHTPYISNSVSANSFCLKLCLSPHTHIHKHTCSPRPAKRKRWLVNKQWHSAHSVTRMGFDQHRCSCSPQQCFLSFCLPNATMHAHAHTPIT